MRKIAYCQHKLCTNFTSQVHILIVKMECLIVQADSDEILGNSESYEIFWSSTYNLLWQTNNSCAGSLTSPPRNQFQEFVHELTTARSLYASMNLSKLVWKPEIQLSRAGATWSPSLRQLQKTQAKSIYSLIYKYIVLLCFSYWRYCMSISISDNVFYKETQLFP
jgi:hypothetical protein